MLYYHYDGKWGESPFECQSFETQPSPVRDEGGFFWFSDLFFSRRSAGNQKHLEKRAMQKAGMSHTSFRLGTVVRAFLSSVVRFPGFANQKRRSIMFEKFLEWFSATWPVIAGGILLIILWWAYRDKVKQYRDRLKQAFPEWRAALATLIETPVGIVSLVVTFLSLACGFSLCLFLVKYTIIPLGSEAVGVFRSVPTPPVKLAPVQPTPTPVQPTPTPPQPGAQLTPQPTPTTGAPCSSRYVGSVPHGTQNKGDPAYRCCNGSWINTGGAPCPP